MTVELQRVLSHFNAVDGKAECPLCHHHSLAIDPGKDAPYLVHCYSCGPDRQKELAALAFKVAKDTAANIHKVNVTSYTRKEWTEDQLHHTLTIARQNLLKDKAAQSFLSDRGIPLVLAQSFALGCGEFYHEQRLCIPYLNGVFGESVMQLRYRRLKESKNKQGKWACEKRMLGGRRLFNLPTLINWNAADTEPLIVTESELDCMMLVGFGVQAISVDTAGHRLIEEDLLLLRKVKNLVLAFDQDEAGDKCTARFKQYLPAARILGGYKRPRFCYEDVNECISKCGHYPDVKDLGELHKAMGAVAFKTRLERFLERRLA